MRTARRGLVLTADERLELGPQGLYPRYQGSIYFHIRAKPKRYQHELQSAMESTLTDMFSCDQREAE
jgi:hypothetical protein